MNGIFIGKVINKKGSTSSMGNFVYKYVYKGEIIYFGKNDTNLKTRIEQHKREEKFQQYRSSDIYYIELANKAESKALEALLINHYKPKLNDVDKYDTTSSLIQFVEPEWKKYEDCFEESKFMPELSEIDMAVSLVDKLFSLKTNDERVSFGRKLRAKKNRHTIKTDIEYEYWNNVMNLIDNEIALRLFGENYNKDEMSLFIDGFGQIVIDLDGFGRLIYFPNDNTFKIPHVENKIFSKKEFFGYIDSILEKINTYKMAFV